MKELRMMTMNFSPPSDEIGTITMPKKVGGSIVVNITIAAVRSGGICGG